MFEQLNVTLTGNALNKDSTYMACMRYVVVVKFRQKVMISSA